MPHDVTGPLAQTIQTIRAETGSQLVIDSSCVPVSSPDGSDAGQIDLVGLPAMCKAADPGGADFLDVAFDEGTGIDEVDRHVTAARG